MHYIKHEYKGVVSGRWYKIDHQRHVRFTIENHHLEYTFVATKGYGMAKNGKEPRQSCAMRIENRGTLRAAEKSYNRAVKEYLHKYPMMVQKLQEPLPEASDKPAFLKLAGGLG